MRVSFCSSPAYDPKQQCHLAISSKQNLGIVIVVFIGPPITHVSGVHPVQHWSVQAPIAAGAHTDRPSTSKTYILATVFLRVARSTYLCENVRNILGAENFEQLDLFAPDFVLDPHVRHVQVTDLAKTFAPRNTYCGRSVAVYSGRHCPTHIAPGLQGIAHNQTLCLGVPTLQNSAR